MTSEGSDYPRPTADSLYQYVINFGAEEEGSDLWLFKKTSNFGSQSAWEKLSVLLTSQFEGKVWYDLRPQENQIVLYAEPTKTYNLEPKTYAVSYQLSAPRVDSAKWGNLNHDGVQGIDVREFGGQ